LHFRADLLLPDDEAARARTKRDVGDTRGPGAAQIASSKMASIKVEIEINKPAIEDLQKEGTIDTISSMECTKTT
jgi:hypothetical protein